MSLLVGARRTLLRRVTSAGDSSYSAESTAFFARMATDPGETRKGVYNTFINALKTGAVSGSNIWAKLDIIYLLAAHEESTGLLNLKGATYNATKTGTLTFTADEGFLGDGATGYLDTGLADNAGGVNWSQDSAFLAAYVNVESAGTTIPVVGTSGTSNQALLVPLQSGTGRARIHVGANAVVTPSVANRLGWTIGNRSSSTDLVAMRDTVTGASQTTASTAPVAATINLFRNATATPSFAADQLAAFAMGGSLTANERTDFINAANAYLTAVGAL